VDRERDADDRHAQPVDGALQQRQAVEDEQVGRPERGRESGDEERSATPVAVGDSAQVLVKLL
jgi:hypothetical protein